MNNQPFQYAESGSVELLPTSTWWQGKHLLKERLTTLGAGSCKHVLTGLTVNLKGDSKTLAALFMNRGIVIKYNDGNIKSQRIKLEPTVDGKPNVLEIKGLMEPVFLTLDCTEQDVVILADLNLKTYECTIAAHCFKDRMFIGEVKGTLLHYYPIFLEYHAAIWDGFLKIAKHRCIESELYGDSFIVRMDSYITYLKLLKNTPSMGSSDRFESLMQEANAMINSKFGRDRLHDYEENLFEFVAEVLERYLMNTTPTEQQSHLEVLRKY